MPEIRHIVFDIGKVLLHYDPELPFTRLIADADRRRWFLSTVCTPAWNIEQDRGRTWSDAEALLIAQYPEEADLIRAFRLHWGEMVPHAIDDSVALMLELIDAGRDVTMLTNFASDTFAEARGRFPFLDRPRGVTVSGDIGLLKPDREIYDRHAADFGLDPAKTVFIDDTEKNVQGARLAGWQALWFEGAEKLAMDLRRLGLS